MVVVELSGGRTCEVVVVFLGVVVEVVLLVVDDVVVDDVVVDDVVVEDEVVVVVIGVSGPKGG